MGTSLLRYSWGRCIVDNIFIPVRCGWNIDGSNVWHTRIKSINFTFNTCSFIDNNFRLTVKQRIDRNLRIQIIQVVAVAGFDHNVKFVECLNFRPANRARILFGRVNFVYLQKIWNKIPILSNLISTAETENQAKNQIILHQTKNTWQLYSVHLWRAQMCRELKCHRLSLSHKINKPFW